MTNDHTPNPLITSRADVTTAMPCRYAKQLVAYLGRKLAFTADGATSTAAIGTATAQAVVGASVLSLIAAGTDEEAVTRAQHVLGSHLERFGQRNELTVTWERSNGTGEGTS